TSATERKHCEQCPLVHPLPQKPIDLTGAGGGEGMKIRERYHLRLPSMMRSDACLIASIASVSLSLNLRFRCGSSGRGDFHQCAVAQTAALSTCLGSVAITHLFQAYAAARVRWLRPPSGCGADRGPCDLRCESEVYS